ncbi:MAG: hypothetical protein AAB393_19120, partial [Bacteroidota bacterium]
WSTATRAPSAGVRLSSSQLELEHRSPRRCPIRHTTLSVKLLSPLKAALAQVLLNQGLRPVQDRRNLQRGQSLVVVPASINTAPCWQGGYFIRCAVQYLGDGDSGSLIITGSEVLGATPLATPNAMLNRVEAILAKWTIDHALPLGEGLVFQ